MSQMVRYKGKVQKVEKLEEETLEQQCQRLIGGELEEHFDSWEEKLNWEHDEKYVICKGEIYEFIALKQEDTEFNIFEAHENNDGTFGIHVMYYNGSCGLSEAIERAIDGINK